MKVTREQREIMAKEFAEWHGVEVQEWMLWDGWHLWVGCEVCAEEGEDAPCWGYQGCHGHKNGCGCFGCAVTNIEEDLIVQMGIRNKWLDSGSIQRVHDIALRITEGKLGLTEAIEVWHQQPDLPDLNAKVRAWHSAISLRLFARAKRGD